MSKRGIKRAVCEYYEKNTTEGLMTSNELRSGEGLRLRSHTVHLDDRRILSITGVADVGSFNEREITLLTDAGAMLIEGEGLHITRLDLVEGVIGVEGEIAALEYEEDLPRKKGSLLSRMFR